jgi:hypothetical protein
MLPRLTTRKENDFFNTVAHYHRRRMARRLDSAAGLMASSQATNINQPSSITISWLQIISMQTFRWNRFSAAKLICG